ncbi:hypothetical protein DID88_000328 [Monilinia fructigena]|uniref:Amino acid permease/ SLC12A domain-containing protein n=1 Tax=Monilinia fructigena TaxID=38457 RepID=A0A395IH83_9HELO|nr:hypothetical protein DID88_000328 [Monilinia fructigena]
MALKNEYAVNESALHVTSIFPEKTGDHAVIGHEADADEGILVSLGYKQEFKRELTIRSSFGVSFSCLGLLPSIASTLGFNLAYSGPAGSVWGWLVAGVLIQFVALAMAELCSSMPTAGGLYYASAVLAPEGYGPLCSWITGWSNFAGEVTAPCALNYALAAMILTAAQIVHPEYVIQTYHWTMAGYDAPFHLSEECSNANIAGPRAIILTAQLGLWLGWASILVIAYTVKDIQDVVSGQYGQPMGSLCLQVLGPKAGLAMFSLNIFAQFFVGQGVTVVSSRVVYAYSRDGALPGSYWLKQVNSHTKTPVYAVWFVLILGALLGLLTFASPVAIGAIFSMGAIAQYLAFIFPIALKLFSARGSFRPGPWNLGRFSTPIGFVAVAWVTLIIPILCFPSVTGADLNALNMNYTCVMYGGVMVLAMVWYAVSARKWFKGPKINVDHLIHGDRTEAVELAIVGGDEREDESGEKGGQGEEWVKIRGSSKLE